MRGEVRLLGKLLGEAIRAHSGEELFALVERVRALSKRGRRADRLQLRELETLSASLDPRHALPLARAFAHFLRLANLAEQRYRARAERLDGPDSLSRALARLAGGSAARLQRALLDLRIELVLTAHPTQVVRRTLLNKYRRIAELLEQRQARGLPQERQAQLLTDLRREVFALWTTDELRRRRPTPVDEARAGLALFEKVLWDAVPAFVRDLDAGLRHGTGTELSLDTAPVRFASWIGGDRDGNPNVTPEVTAEVCLLARRLGTDLYVQELERLHDELSVGPCNRALRARVGESREPYRALLRQAIGRFEATRRWCDSALRAVRSERRLPPPETGLQDPDGQLRIDLILCRTSLEESGLGLLAEGRLLDLLRRLSAFGTSLARLDIRQEAGVHTAALDELSRAAGLGPYADWDEEKRRRFLLRWLASRRPPARPGAPAGEALRGVLQTLDVCAAQPRGSLGAYVVSMASRPSDVLAVYLLQRVAGIAAPMRVVPLFETLDDLFGAPGTMTRLLALPWYRRQVRDGVEIMVGYSDSAKDAGRVAAAWALYRAQRRLASLCSAARIPLTLFHGRGGTIARGGGPISLAIASQPPRSIRGRLRVTIQGEAIDSSFGLPELARASLARYTLATLEATLRPAPPPGREWRGLMDQLARAGAVAYRRTLRDPSFLPYFRAATPQRELQLLNIGSRPASRRRDSGLESLRAIPWIFAWTQTRLLLPSWLGAGDALRAARESGKASTLRAMARDWPFFGALLDLLEMVLAKTDPEIAARYDAALVPEELRRAGQALRRRLRATRAELLRVRGRRRLLAKDPFLRTSIALRNPYVDPLNLLQVELLRRLRARENTALRDALLVTIGGVAAGMRNTG